MSLVQFFRILYARRIILIVALVSALFAGVVMIKVLPKRYTAHARIMLDVIKPDPVTGQVLGTQFLRSYTKTQIELIKDYQTAGKVVDRLGWANNPEIVQSYYASGDATPDGLRRWLAGQVISGTDAGLIEASNILEITFTGPNPDLAKRIVTVIREVYMRTASPTSSRAPAGRPTGSASRPPRRKPWSRRPRRSGPSSPPTTASSCRPTTPTSKARDSAPFRASPRPPARRR